MTLPQYKSPTEAASGSLSLTKRSTRTQETTQGHEIPVPTKSQILGDFTKIATAKHDDEDDSGSNSSKD